MASGSVYTFVPTPDGSLDELEEKLRDIALDEIADGDYRFDDGYYESDEELVDTNVKTRHISVALLDIRRIPQRDIAERLCARHPDLVDGIIRVGAETTRGSMTARMYDVDDDGEWEREDRVSKDSYPIGGHTFAYKGVKAENPQL